ncbi:hypothetical protein EIP91_004248 [Steccherinum ochraceum]|uniref:Pentacotripeptide-repeat region of PRORP domain-containing protein n=1 Tax=Steccherinum ochraceum TaxID=92696 RepID=A0A4R0RKL3_9APHY|nr:hypothetical protein EIP91_004248 [Steccherinum ochraceum]
MLRVSSLGLKCRRHAPFSTHAGVLRRTRVVSVAGKAPVSLETHHHKLLNGGHHLREGCEEAELEVRVHTRVTEVAGEGESEMLAMRHPVTIQDSLVPRDRKVHNRALAAHDSPRLQGTSQVSDAVESAEETTTNQTTISRGLDMSSSPRPQILPAHESVSAKFNSAMEALRAPQGGQNGQRRAHVKKPPGPPPLAVRKASRPRAQATPIGTSNQSPRHRRELLSVMATTSDLSAAWQAYETLLSLPHDSSRLSIPWEHLHRMTRLIASTKPRTRSLFTRLLSVISTVHRTGGRVELWEWNTLIDFAGKGWRRTSQEDFRNAFDVYNDMVNGNAPGAGFSSSGGRPGHREKDRSIDHPSANPPPDVVTLTTLLNIAASTMHKPTLQFAANLQRSSGIPPNRVTLLSYLRYFTRSDDLSGVRNIISQMELHGFEIGLDGVNAYLWAYAHAGRLDVASAIYTILHSRSIGKPPDAYTSAVSYLRGTEAISVPEGIKPDKITYTSLLQAYAFHGHLTRCLQVFMDFTFSVKKSGDDEQQVELTMQMIPIYRAIFLGFARHGTSHLSQRLHNVSGGVHTAEPDAWNMQKLDALFSDFLAIPASVKPSPRMLWWIMVAYARTSGRDTRKLQEVLSRLKERFPHQWGWRMRRLEQRIFQK